MTTVIGAAFLLSRALSVSITALNAGSCKAAGSVWRWTAALLHCQHGLEELTAGNTFPVLLGKHALEQLEVGLDWKQSTCRFENAAVLSLEVNEESLNFCACKFNRENAQ